MITKASVFKQAEIIKFLRWFFFLACLMFGNLNVNQEQVCYGDKKIQMI